MATITQKPELVTPSDNPILWVYRQNPTVSGNDKYNVSFVIELFIRGASVGLFESKIEIISNDYLFGKIDLSDKIRAYISNHAVATTNFNYDPSNYSEVFITIREKYSLAPDLTPTINQSTLITDDIIYVFKGSLDRNEFKDWNYTLYKKTNGQTRFLTDRYSFIQGGFRRYAAQSTKKDTHILSWFESTYLDVLEIYKIRIDYNWTGGTYVQTLTINTVDQGLIRTLRFNMDEQLALGNITQSTYDNTTEVQIRLVDEFGLNSQSGRYSITIANNCFDNGANLLWLNKFGSYDNYRFTYNSRISAKIETKSFTKSQGEWVETVYNLNNNTFGKLDYLKTIIKQLELSSDWLTEEEQAYICNLYESPLVYLNESTEVENIIVTNSAYQIKQSEHDDLFNEIVNIEFTNKKSISL